MKPINWQIRINVFGTTEEAYAAHDSIANAMGRERFNNIRLINIDKGEDEVDDETQIFCKSCGRLDGALHDYVCDACLILEKEKRQQEEDAKYDDDKRGTEWDWVAFCPECGLPANYDSDECYWYCPHGNCTNYLPDRSVNADKFEAHRLTIAELAELKKKYAFAEWV